MKATRRRAGWWLCVLAIALPTPARAGADPDPAKALFDEARELAKAGKWPEACEKLEASRKLAPKMLTTYRLADCHERVGRTASAHAGFLTAAELAKAAGDADKQQDAVDRARQLEPKLSRIALDLPKDEPKLSIKVDGAPLPAALTLEKLPLDPGEHTLVATAPGKQARTVTFQVPPGPALTTVTVPALEPVERDEPEPAKTPSETGETPPPKGAQGPATDAPPAGGTTKTLGYVALGVGVVGLGVSTWLGVSAKSLDREAEQLCTPRGCTPEGKQLGDDARARGNLATIVFGVGAVAAVSGLVLVLTAPESPAKSASVAPWIGLGSGGVALSGSF